MDCDYRPDLQTVPEYHGHGKRWKNKRSQTRITFDSDIASDIVTYLLSAADYNEYANTDLTLKDDEILIYSSGKEWKKGDTLNFMGKEYTVAGEADYSCNPLYH